MNTFQLLGESSWYEINNSNVRIYIRTGKKSSYPGFIEQLENCLALSPFPEPSIYVDECVSSKSHQPAFIKLCQDLDENEYVIISNISRLTKNIEKAKEISKLFNDKKVNLIYYESSFYGNLDSKLYRQVKKIQIEQKIYKIFTKKYKKVVRNTQAPYGWKKENTKLIEVKEEQEIINRIKVIRSLNPDYTLSQMCRLIDVMGIKIGKTKKCYPMTLKRIFIHNNIK
jgi:DNA invertase Pin-like site-specific DNA recombinase